MIASGLGYNGRKEVSDTDEVDAKDPDSKGPHQWDKFVGVYLYDCEMATNGNTFLNRWNYRIHVWLKYYIAERLTGKGNRPTTGQYLITFMTSAFWHGFYPFYYVAFFFALLVSFAHKDLYNMWILFRPIPAPIRTFFCIILTSFCVNWGLVIQNALTFEKGLKFLGTTYYFGFVALIVILVVSRGLGLLSMAKKLERAEKEQ